jgi:site-specific DNA recombinase
MSLQESVRLITLYRDRIEIEQNSDGSHGARTPDPLILPFVWQPQTRRKGIVHESTQKPAMDSASARALLTGIGRARSWMSKLIEGCTTTEAIAVREGLTERYVRRLLMLACLSPTIIRAISDGSAPATLTTSAFTMALPQSWAEQEHRFLSR